VSLRIEKNGPIALLRLDKARANAIDEALLDALLAACEDVARDDSVRGVLLCSAHPRVFCPGLDLTTLEDYDPAALERFMLRFSEAVTALYGLWKPVVAAIAGHAVAGGCIVALTADLRLLSRGGAQMGLNEVRIGVPLPWSVTVLLRASLPPASFTAVALEGRNFSDDEAARVGLAHEILPAEDFEAACLERLSRLADKDAVALGTTKRYLREGFLSEMKAHEAARVGAFVSAWFTDATRARRREILASLKKT
jgi:enoyl-CoA hydratase/carnithine racemase